MTLLDSLPPSLLAINPHLARRKPRGTPRWKRPVEVSGRLDGGTVSLVFKGLVLVSEANTREHWTVKAARAKWQRATVTEALGTLPVPRLPVRVTIVRVGPRALDLDNSWGSAKFVTDAIAAWCEVDDGDVARFRCSVSQERGGYGVRVVIEGAA